VLGGIPSADGGAREGTSFSEGSSDEEGGGGSSLSDDVDGDVGSGGS